MLILTTPVFLESLGTIFLQKDSFQKLSGTWYKEYYAWRSLFCGHFCSHLVLWQSRNLVDFIWVAWRNVSGIWFLRILSSWGKSKLFSGRSRREDLCSSLGPWVSLLAWLDLLGYMSSLVLVTIAYWLMGRDRYLGKIKLELTGDCLQRVSSQKADTLSWLVLYCQRTVPGRYYSIHLID